MHSLVEAGPPRLASFNGVCHGFAHVGPHGSVRKTLLANPGERSPAGSRADRGTETRAVAKLRLQEHVSLGTLS